MTSTSDNTRSATHGQQYRATWRWHFFAGVIVVPFLLVLAITGLVMVYYTSVQTPLAPAHQVYAAMLLCFFLLSGLAWTNIWGGKFVQAWNSFPAEKWGPVSLADTNHGAMNHGAAKEVPWGLEQTPLPASTAHAHPAGHDAHTVVNLDTVDERTVHVDRHSGQIVAEIGFDDYSFMAQSMAVGIGVHQANMGRWNIALNVLACLTVIFLCVSGTLLWWLRHPAGSRPLLPVAGLLLHGVMLIRR